MKSKNPNSDFSFDPSNNPRPKCLTPQQIDDFNQNGFISPLDVLSDSEVELHRENVSRAMNLAKQKGFDHHSLVAWEGGLPFLYDLCTHPKILDPVEDLIGPNIVCWFSVYFCKNPHDDVNIGMHQDASYWPLSHYKGVSIWLAVDDADASNGQLTMLPGSHQQGEIGYEYAELEEKNLIHLVVRDAEKYGEPVVPINLKAGQMSVFSPLVLHGSKGNTSNRRRCGLVIRYFAPEVRHLEDYGYHSIVCRGEDPYGHWAKVHVPRPETEWIPASVRKGWRADLPENHS